MGGLSEIIKQLVLNLYGGPGTGKSTGMAYIFAILKMLMVRAEFAHEFAKDLTWEGRGLTLQDQLYIFGKQQKKLNMLRGKVDIVITDSPLLFSLVYGDKVEQPSFNNIVRETYRSYDNIDVFLRRVKPFDPAGRGQDEAEARELDHKIMERCFDSDPSRCLIADGDFHGYNAVIGAVLNRLRPEMTASWLAAAEQMAPIWEQLQILNNEALYLRECQGKSGYDVISA